VRVIARSTLRSFWEKHTDAREQLLAWLAVAERSDWRSPSEIKATFPSADVLPGNRIVFNIKGNHYRLIVKIHFNTKIVYIRFVGTHAEYDRIDAETV
jgi:mRNA interferase HigB